MSDADVPAEALALIEAVAGAIRDELGEEIDAYPGPPRARAGRPAQPRLPGRRPGDPRRETRRASRARPRSSPGPCAASPSGGWRRRAGTTARSSS